MASGAEDYHLTVSRNMLSALDLSVEKLLLVASGMTDVVTATELSITKLLEIITELQVHTEKLTIMIAYGEEDWGGNYHWAPWSLVSDTNVKRNMLRVTISGDMAAYSRDGGYTTDGYINDGSSAVFNSSPGVWITGAQSGYNGAFTAHEEWAT